MAKSKDKTSQQNQLTVTTLTSEALTDQDILDRLETTDPNSETDTDTVIKFLEHEKQTTQHS